MASGMSGVVSASISIGSVQSGSNWWNVDDPGSADNDVKFNKLSEENEKECLIWVFDASADMIASGSLKTALEVAVKSMKRKIIMKPQDPVSVVLYNTKGGSENVDFDEFNNITVVRDLQEPTASLIQAVKTLVEKPPEPLVGAQVDFAKVLTLSKRMMDKEDPTSSKYGYKRIFFFSRNDLPHHLDIETLKQSAQDMRDNGFELNLFPMKPQAEFRVMNFWAHIMSIPKDEFLSEKLLYGKCSNFEELEETIRVREMKKRCLTTVPLSIGKDFNISVKLYNLKMSTKIPSPQWLDPKNNEQLTTVTQYVCADTGSTLDDTQFETYHEFGDMQVLFTKDDMNELKKVDEPSLRVMGFKPRSRLKHYHQIKPAYFIYPTESVVTGSRQAFKVLLQACAEEDRIAICRFTSRKGTLPQMVALVPQKEILEEDGAQAQPPGFHLHFLPYADDIRKPSIPPMRSAKDDEELIRKAKKLVKSLYLGGLPDLCNPHIQKHYDMLEALALEEELNEETKDETMEMFEENKEKYAKAAEAWEDFLEMLPEPQVKAKKRKRKDDGGGRKKKAPKKSKEASAGSAVKEEDWKAVAESGQLKKKKIPELKQYLADNGLSRSGKKADLIERIRSHLGVS